MSNQIITLRRLKKRYHDARKKPDVWIVDEHRFAFIQIRKVASRSSKYAICQFLLDDSATEITEDYIERVDRQYAHHISNRHLARLAQTHYIFTIVRNPLARLYSYYRNKVVDEKNRNLPLYGLDADMSFAQVVHRVAELSDRESNSHFQSQHTFLTYRDRLIPDTVCKIESLALDWQIVRQHIPGFPDLPKLNQTNFSGKSTFINAYDKALAQIAYERYHRDITLFGYEDDVKNMIAQLPA